MAEEWAQQVDPQKFVLEYLHSGRALTWIKDMIGTDPMLVLRSLPAWNTSCCPCGLSWDHEGRCWWFYQNNDVEPKRGTTGKKCSTCVLYLQGGIGIQCRTCWFAKVTRAFYGYCRQCGGKKPPNGGRRCKKCQQHDAHSKRIARHAQISDPQYQEYNEERRQKRCLKQGRQLLGQIRKRLKQETNHRVV